MQPSELVLNDIGTENEPPPDKSNQKDLMEWLAFVMRQYQTGKPYTNKLGEVGHEAASLLWQCYLSRIFVCGSDAERQ